MVSFRLGGSDGVSVVAESWARALTEMGFDVVTVAGEGPVDRLVPGLAIGADSPPSPEEVEAALAGADLVVVENLCTIPLHLEASRMVAASLAGRPAILHHHDPPWQRERFAHVDELPPRDEAWRHVTINRLTTEQMAARGIEATTIYNGFDVDAPSGRRASTRQALGVSGDRTLALHPVRAIARKNVPAAIDLCERLGATYWLLGPAEEGYDEELRAQLARARCPVVRGAPGTFSIDDAYAAADLVVFPSTWEGFGNPPIEAALRRRPVAVGPYPVGRELAELGFRWFAADDAEAIAAFLAEPDPAVLDHNHDLAARHFSHESMAAALRELLGEAGWLP